MEELNNIIKAQFEKMCKTGKLFTVDISGNDLWDIYISSFVDDPVFRDPDSSSHNCNLCKNFLRRYGNVVAVNDKLNVLTLFDIVLEESSEYYEPVKALQNALKKASIDNAFFEDYNTLNNKLNYESTNKTQVSYKLGIEQNFKKYTAEEAKVYGVVKAGEIHTFNHLCVDLPKKFVNFSNESKEAIQGKFRDKYSVFERGIKEISLDTLKLVRDLINQGSLLDGTSHLHSINEFITLAGLYENIPDRFANAWFWAVSYDLEERTAKFKNTLIGVLCTELAEGMELNKACENWNKRVDPANYHKATAPITKKQIEEAKKFVEENGYTESFNRRLAVMSDIHTSEIKHLNAGDGKINEVSIFDNLKTTFTRHKRSEFDKIQEVSIEKFLTDIVPDATALEVWLENSHEGNFVTLTTSKDENSKSIFKWDNNYSWTFNGNLAGKSQIKQAVKTAGGNIDALLRFSIMWSEGDDDQSDLDAHAKSNKELIYYGNRRGNITKGVLDIDVTNPKAQMPNGAVENITFNDITTLKGREITFSINQFRRDKSKGFKAQIEFGDETYDYEYNGIVNGNNIIAKVKIDSLGNFSIKHVIQPSNGTREIWNLETNQFHKVNLMCVSPNHWGENAIGNKHYMFMLENCKTDTPTRGFHNENLLPDLLKHKKVMEVLGNTAMIEPTKNQLSGIGFNSTVKDEVIVKVRGTHQRVIKVKF